jgi:hypothetical protein
MEGTNTRALKALSAPSEDIKKNLGLSINYDIIFILYYSIIRMTTIAYHQYSNIPNMGGSYASAPVIGPLSTNKTPLQMGVHNRGILSGKHPNPPQYYPSDGAGTFSNGRHQYRRTTQYREGRTYNFGRGIQQMSSDKPAGTYYSGDLQKRFKVSQLVKYVPPADSSLYISHKKSNAIGKSSLKQGLPDSTPLGYKSYNQNDVKNALRCVRGGGSVAPAKKGAIANLYKSISPLRPTYTDPLFNTYNYVEPTKKAVTDKKNIFSFSSGYPQSGTGYTRINTTAIAAPCHYETYTNAINAINHSTSLVELEKIVSCVNDNTIGDYEAFFAALNDKIQTYS